MSQLLVRAEGPSVSSWFRARGSHKMRLYPLQHFYDLEMGDCPRGNIPRVAGMIYCSVLAELSEDSPRSCSDIAEVF